VIFSRDVVLDVQVLPHLSSTYFITARRLLIQALPQAIGPETALFEDLLASPPLARIASQEGEINRPRQS
jgi:hypothetical protein